MLYILCILELIVSQLTNATSRSQTSWRQPSCIALPKSASEVQTLVRLLSSHNVPFAIRSGGHSPAPSDANIDIGVLISMDMLNHISADGARHVVSIGPGARWGDEET